ncbi:glycosyltransferase family protein [Falsiroseomonas oryzae]|uniref:hypothetical protein n=1 Tax=Falsiroseomonas oryzae TaxID=2766473 RepID=UPI0022EACD03|nr:hypothetical protein [Roseomonas sp. MO-31]
MNLPEAPGAQWMALMRRGAWEEAWRLSDVALAARDGRRDWTLPRHLQTVWDGSPLAGRRVLVRCYHGLGDTIQFIRLIPGLQAIARDVTVWAQPALIPLLATMRNAPRLLPLHDGTPEAAFDVDVEIMELAHALRLTPATLPARVPYLHPPGRPRLRDGRLAVGLAWRAGDWDARRSVPVEMLRVFAALPGIVLHVLQRGPALDERPAWLPSDAGSDDVLEAAATMRSLDLVVSIDSMPAHLAGALGVPVWLLLAHDADWRWMEGRDDSPWYPTMRLFRQARPGDWADPLGRLADALRGCTNR